MNDWKRDVPFPRHWLVYITVKLVLIAVAVWLAVRAMGWI